MARYILFLLLSLENQISKRNEEIEELNNHLLGLEKKSEISFKDLEPIQYTVIQLLPSKHNLLAKPGALEHTANDKNRFC